MYKLKQLHVKVEVLEYVLAKYSYTSKWRSLNMY